MQLKCTQRNACCHQLHSGFTTAEKTSFWTKIEITEPEREGSGDIGPNPEIMGLPGLTGLSIGLF